MNTLLDLLDPSSCPAIHSATLLVLVTALLGNATATRCFEALDGLLTVSSLFKGKGVGKEVKMRAMEFLYFYLLPEGRVRGCEIGEEETRGTEEKGELLGRYLGGVEDLVSDLRESAPFGVIMI